MIRALTSIRLTLGAAVVAAVLAGLAPQFIDTFSLLQLSVFIAMAVLSLSLGFIWGFGGILSFGQAAFSATSCSTAGSPTSMSGASP